MIHPHPIHHVFGPHVSLRFTLLSLWQLVRPWSWQRGIASKRFADALSQAFDGDAFLYAEGRQGLLSLLRSMKLKAGEEVIIQGYTCCVVANAIHAAGGNVIYADCDRNTLNLTVASVEGAITHRTRAVICQNTFGIPGPLQELRALCDEKNLLLIEDCAHSLPDTSGPAELTGHGHVLLLSFSRDKAFSGITGGAIISRDNAISAQLSEQQHCTLPTSYFSTFRILLYPLTYLLARPVYGLWIGKAFLFALNRLHLLMRILQPSEHAGHMSPVLRHMPNACCAIALDQLKRLKKLNDHRRTIASLYAKHSDWPIVPGALEPTLALQKLPLLTEKADEIRRILKRKNIHLDDGWAGEIVCKAINDDVVNYTRGSCPNAERIQREILSLPIHPTMKKRQTKRLIRELDPLL